MLDVTNSEFLDVSPIVERKSNIITTTSTKPLPRLSTVSVRPRLAVSEASPSTMGGLPSGTFGGTSLSGTTTSSTSTGAISIPRLTLNPLSSSTVSESGTTQTTAGATTTGSIPRTMSPQALASLSSSTSASASPSSPAPSGGGAVGGGGGGGGATSGSEEDSQKQEEGTESTAKTQGGLPPTSPAPKTEKTDFYKSYWFIGIIAGGVLGYLYAKNKGGNLMSMALIGAGVGGGAGFVAEKMMKDKKAVVFNPETAKGTNVNPELARKK